MILDDDLTEAELAKLAKDGSREERFAVAKHANADLQTLLFLCKKGFAQDVDKNPLLPFHIEAGSKDVIYVLENIADQTRDRERLDELASSPFPSVRRIAAWNENIFSKTLSFLANDKNHFVRMAVASNKNTSSRALGVLARDSCADVRFGVACNLKTPSKMLVVLSKDEVVSVRYAAYSTLHNIRERTLRKRSPA